MSKHAAKVGNIGTDHEGFHPTAITAGSPDVLIDGIPAARVGDPLAPHDKPNHPPHPRKISSGSSTVLVNGKPLAITGGSVDCGGIIIGSGTVVVGDMAPPPSTFTPIIPPSPVFDEMIKLVSEEGTPLSNTPYFVELPGGETMQGFTDLNGCVPRIKTEKEDVLRTYFGVVALERWKQ
jgi:uncharacterized Zn-binding protein involved in type VI secretion